MRSRFACISLAGFGSAILLLGIAGAAEPHLTPLATGDTDIDRVVQFRDGLIGIISGARVSFVSPDGTPVKKLILEPDQRIFPGDAGSYYGIARHRYEKADFPPADSFTLYDSSDSEQWSIGPGNDVCFVVSSRGDVVGMRLNINTPDRNSLHFHGSGGSLMREVALPYATGGRFSRNGSVFFALSTTEGLVAYNENGIREWRIPEVRLFAATADGARVSLVVDDELLISGHGVIAARSGLEGLLVRRLAIAPDGSRIAVAGRDELRVYDSTLTMLWRHSLAGTDHVFTSVDVASARGRLLAGTARDLGSGIPVSDRHPDGEVLVFDGEGMICQRIPLVFSSWNIFTPTARFTEKEECAVISTRRSVYLLEMP